MRTVSGWLRGEARGLDSEGALVVGLAGGAETTVVAGDLDVDWPRAENT